MEYGLSQKKNIIIILIMISRKKNITILLILTRLSRKKNIIIILAITIKHFPAKMAVKQKYHKLSYL